MLSQRLIQSYDGLNLNGIVDQLVPANSEYFGYDSVGRLTGASGPFGGLQWTYDLNGNRTAEIVGTAAPYVTHGYSVPSTSNKLSTVTSGSATERSLTYDAAGNLTQDSRGTTPYAFTYNKAGRPAALTIGTAARASYVYDALERLTIRTLTNGTPNLSSHLIYDRAGHLLAETNGAGVTLRDYIWLGDRPTGVIDSTNPAAPILYQVHTDHIGRPFLMTDASKAVVWEAHYKPFGEVWSITGSASLDARFPGQWFQLEDGLLYNWHRHYDPTLGRYTQVDPLSALVTGPDRYGYAGARPQMNMDPDGRDPGGNIQLGNGGYTGQIDIFNGSSGASFEMHVFSPAGNEIGVYGPDGWINKHGGIPKDIDPNLENTVRGVCIDKFRNSGLIPNKGNMNIKNLPISRFVRGLVPMLLPMPDLNDLCIPALNGCYPPT